MTQTLTSEQEVFWNMLKCDPEFLAHHWGKEMSLLKGRKFHEACDEHLNFILASSLSEIELLRIVKTWLSTYDLPLDPSKLKYFDEFHNRVQFAIRGDVSGVKVYE